MLRSGESNFDSPFCVNPFVLRSERFARPGPRYRPLIQSRHRDRFTGAAAAESSLIILRTTLYVRLPHRPHDQPQPWHFGELPFALVRAPLAERGARQGTAAHQVLREGNATIDGLPAADRLVLILAAADVLLTEATVPPLAPARLRLALPNLVEDVLAVDAEPCHIAVGPFLDPAPARAAGAARRRVLMVTERAWLRAVLDAFAAHPHRRRHVLAAQLCLPLPVAQEQSPPEEPADGTADAKVVASPPLPVTVAAPPAALALEVAANALEDATAALLGASVATAPAADDAGSRHWQLSVRTGTYAGYGLLLGDDALTAWQALAPAGTWYGDRTALTLPAAADMQTLSWPVWIAGAQTCLQETALDLAQFEFGQGRADRWNLRAWRIPALLLAALLLVQIVGMNVHWLLLRQEQQRILEAQTHTLRGAFPQIPVLVDPPLQMRRQVDQLRLASGRSTPDDFLPLADRFAQAASQLAPDALRSLEYQGRALHVTLKPGTDTNTLRNAARQAGLAMEEDKSPRDNAAARPPASLSAPAAGPGTRWIIKPGL